MITCPHGQPHPSCCSDCIEENPPPRGRTVLPRPETPAFRARFDGRCGRCGGDIRHGDLIRGFDDDTYRHHPTEACT